MKVFISWSGNNSRLIAEYLREWLPLVSHHIAPWVSSTDITAGSRWNPEIARELESTNFGIICLTSENIEAPWILFEAGTLAKSLSNSHVCPYLIGLEPSDLKGPLAQFQAFKNNKEGTWRLVNCIYSIIETPNITNAQLQTIFDRFWPDLESKFSTIKLTSLEERTIRTERSMLQEVLLEIRQIKREIYTKTKYSMHEYDIGLDTDFIKINIDPSEIGLEGIRVYNIAKDATFQSFLDLLWEELVSSRFKEWTYGSKWILVDKANRIYPKLGKKLDDRKNSEIGVKNNQNLKIHAI